MNDETKSEGAQIFDCYLNCISFEIDYFDGVAQQKKERLYSLVGYN